MDIGGLIVPFLTVLISFILGSYTAKNNLKDSFKKDKLLKFHNDVIHLCYSLPNQQKIDYHEINTFYGEDMFTKVISRNLIYMDKSRIETWSKFNYTLQLRKDPTISIVLKDDFFKPLLNYYSAKIILETLKESKSLEDELGLSEISKELLIKTSPLSFYKEKLPSFEKFQKKQVRSFISKLIINFNWHS